MTSEEEPIKQRFLVILMLWMKAILAVAASMLTDVYYMLRDGVEFHDLGDQYFAQHDNARLTTRLLQRLRDLGVEVEVNNAA